VITTTADVCKSDGDAFKKLFDEKLIRYIALLFVER